MNPHGDWKEKQSHMKGWSGFYRWQLRFLRDILAKNVAPWGAWGLKHKPCSPVQRTRARKKYSYNIWLWKSAGILSTKEMQESYRDIGWQTKSCSPPLTLGSGAEGEGEWGWSRLELCENWLGLVTLGRKLKVEPLGSLCWVPLPHYRCHNLYLL